MQYCKVSVDEVIKLDCKDDGNLGLKKNDWCIIRCEGYEDYGRVIYLGDMPATIEVRGLCAVQRRATLRDQGRAHENSVRGKSFHRTATEKIRSSTLPMKLVSTHYAFDRSIVIFTFTAPDRVDFRGLLRDLNEMLKLKVEFRQIGPRDYAGMVGGVDTCGRTLCCSTFLTNFVGINMKMAKEQGISLNPSNIIGACGRLKCCMAYEYEGYKLLMKSMPKPGSRCKCQGCDGKVIDGNALTQTVKVALDNGARVVTVPISELTDYHSMAAADNDDNMSKKSAAEHATAHSMSVE